MTAHHGEAWSRRGCGAVPLSDPVVGEIEPIWVSERVRGRGTGGRLLDEPEARARTAHTPGSPGDDPEPRRGHRDVPPPGLSRGTPFNDEHYADHWFEKDLDPSSSAEAGDTIGSAAKGGSMNDQSASVHDLLAPVSKLGVGIVSRTIQR